MSKLYACSTFGTIPSFSTHLSKYACMSSSNSSAGGRSSAVTGFEPVLTGYLRGGTDAVSARSAQRAGEPRVHGVEIVGDGAAEALAIGGLEGRRDRRIGGLVVGEPGRGAHAGGGLAGVDRLEREPRP